MLNLAEGEEPPEKLRKDFLHLMELITSVYEQDLLNLQLSADFWCFSEQAQGLDGSYVGTTRMPHKQVILQHYVIFPNNAVKNCK